MRAAFILAVIALGLSARSAEAQLSPLGAQANPGTRGPICPGSGALCAPLPVPGGGATTYTLMGPSSGKINAASSNFTVAPVGTLSGSATVTPSDASHNGIFSPTTVIMTGPAAATFVYTPLRVGTLNISTTNNDSLIDPSPVSFTVSNIAPGYPGFVSGWASSSVTLTPSVSGDPFGGSAAASLLEGSNSAYHFIYTSSPMTVTSGHSYTLSVMVKRGVGTRNVDLSLLDPTAAAALVAVFNTSTGAFIASAGWGGSVLTSTASRSMGSGWWLIQMTGTLGAYSTANMDIWLDNGGNAITNYTGDGTSTVLVYGPVTE